MQNCLHEVFPGMLQVMISNGVVFSRYACCKNSGMPIQRCMCTDILEFPPVGVQNRDDLAVSRLP